MTASLALLTSTAHAETCWYPQEAKAAQLRDFHIMLMVGTLQCKTTNPITVRDYNSFVSRQSLVLDTNKHLLRAHFLRDVGPNEADSAYDSYSTATANALEHKITADPNVCARIDTLARVAAVANFADLMVLAQTFEARQFNTACPVSAYPVVEESLPPRDGPLMMASAAPPPNAVPSASAPDGASPPPNQADDAAAWRAGFASGNSAEANAPPPPIAAREEAPAQSAAAASPANDPAQMKAALAALQAAVTALQAAVPTAQPALAAAHAPAGKAELIAVKVQDAPVIPPKD